MNIATPSLKRVAERLLAWEAKENLTQASRMPAALLVCEKLRPPLATLMGRAGFGALLGRAVVLTIAEIPWPFAVQVRTDGRLAGVEQLEIHVARKEFSEACVVLIAHLLGLLVAFIGEGLTYRLLREIWPEISFIGTNTGPETNL